jgi:hypothetical protein
LRAGWFACGYCCGRRVGSAISVKRKATVLDGSSMPMVLRCFAGRQSLHHLRPHPSWTPDIYRSSRTKLLLGYVSISRASCCTASLPLILAGPPRRCSRAIHKRLEEIVVYPLPHVIADRGTTLSLSTLLTPSGCPPTMRRKKPRPIDPCHGPARTLRGGARWSSLSCEPFRST